jgi:dihydropteroate synthase
MSQPFYCGRFTLDVSRPLIMGIVNLTDDSFSGDALHGNHAAAIAQGRRLVEEGAHILDIGAESSRPGAAPVSIQREIDRLMPVIEGLMECGVPISIDTLKPEVMHAVLAAGVDMINDINALQAPGCICKANRERCNKTRTMTMWCVKSPNFWDSAWQRLRRLEFR